MGLDPTENLLRWHSDLFLRYFECHYKKSYSHYTSNLTALSQHEEAEIRPKWIYSNARFHLLTGELRKTERGQRTVARHALLFYESVTMESHVQIFQFQTINPLKRTFSCYLSFQWFRELHLIHLAVTFKNKRETFTMSQLRNVLEGMGFNQTVPNLTLKLPPECFLERNWAF